MKMAYLFFLLLFIITTIAFCNEDNPDFEEKSQVTLDDDGAHFGNYIYSYTMPGLNLFLFDLQVSDPEAYRELLPVYKPLKDKDNLVNTMGWILVVGGSITVTSILGLWAIEVFTVSMLNCIGDIFLCCGPSSDSEPASLDTAYLVGLGVGAGISIIGFIFLSFQVSEGEIKTFYSKYNEIR